MIRLLPAIASLTLLAACSPSTTGSGTASGQAALSIPPLKYHYRQLANGLRVYAMPDTSTSNAAVQVWYDVGSKDDPVGRSGFAHLFEHLMFKATRDLPAESFDRLTEDVGGYNNASTASDFTDYFEVVPANQLQRVLWAEAERMSSLVVDKASFESERDVVEEELRQRVLASPYGRLFYLYLPQANYTVHPYGRPGIGSIEDLDKATITDVRAFHAEYYRPDNAVLVVAGNFDEAQLDAWVDKYFGPIPKPARKIPRVTAVEPERTTPREYTVYEPNVPLPAILMSYPQPGARSPDMAALTVLDAILSTGEDSRLYQAMVYKQQVATEVFTNLDDTIDPGTYALIAILSSGKTPDEGLKSLAAEIARVRDEQVTEQELDEAKNEIVTGTLEDRETAVGRSRELADSVIRYGDPAGADRLLNEIQRVTAADVQRVARKVLDDSKRVTIEYLPQKDANGAKGDTITTSQTIEAQTLDIPASEVPVYTLAPKDERVAPPPAGPPVEAKLPPTESRILANGLRVIVASSHRLPLISADLRIAAGSSADPTERAGEAGLTAGLVTQGTTTRSATDIARAIESLGASLNSGAGRDSSSVSLETRSDRVDDAFVLMADVAHNPVFADDEFARARRQALDALTVSLQQPGDIASMALTRAVFGTTPYGGVSTPRSLQAMTRDDVAAFHTEHWRPDNAVLVVSGDVTPEQGFDLAERHFGDWPRPEGAAPAVPDAAAPPPSPRTIVIDLPKTGQAAVTMGMIGTARRSDDYFAAMLANSVLGGGYSARLNEEIRIKRGLSYGASSGMPARLAPPLIVASAQTRNDAAAQVVSLMQTEIAGLGATPVSADELNARKSAIVGSYGRSVETTAGVAGQLATLALFGLPPERLQTFVDDVNAVTADQVQSAARRYFDPSHADTVVVGDADKFYDDLREARPNAERIEVSDLDLDKQALR